METVLPAVEVQVNVLEAPTVTDAGENEPLTVGAVPQLTPFQVMPVGQAHAEPFQVWPPVQMLAQVVPFHAVPAEQMLWQACDVEFQAVPPGHEGRG